MGSPRAIHLREWPAVKCSWARGEAPTMELVPVNCNGCGAALDVGPETRFVTCVQCGARLAVKRSETAAYTEALEELDKKTDAIVEQLAEIRLQNEIERIDREWEQERDRYMISHKNGTKTEPNATMGIVMAIGAGLFVLVWIGFAASMGAPGEFLCFGCVFVVVVALMGVTQVNKAKEYESAYARYRKRRSDAANASNPGES